eukprot:TRINITY_DN22319_c0_g1_i6.p1 TRINITY_DN22319_c0_g1~~TRINITY_DN22319_c0_g1_i6.p1  ORF type:complete len:389 (-),score=66.58 TRINITY_DN22319_c0_g1_i6:1178-2344(-)
MELPRWRPKKRWRRAVAAGALTVAARRWPGAHAASQNEDAAAQGATSYWKGGRVRQAAENFNKAPDIETEEGGGLVIDYHGSHGVQECMEFYIDKNHEEFLRRELEQIEIDADEAARDRGAASSLLAAPGEKPRGIVTYLLMENIGRTLYRDMLLSLHCLGKYFNDYPVAIFHTNGSTEQELRHLREESPPGLELILEEVHLEFPPEILHAPGGPDAFMAPPRCTMEGKHWWASNRSCGCRCPAWQPQCWPLNWMHATRFFTAGMFRTKTLASGNYDYFLRLDTDLFFVERPVVDPFRLMANRGCAMVYDRLSREAPGCFDGFDERTIEFLDAHGLRGAAVDEDMLHVGRGPAAAGGQWTIGDARVFGSNAYLRFADYFASGCIGEWR